MATAIRRSEAPSGDPANAVAARAAATPLAASTPGPQLALRLPPAAVPIAVAQPIVDLVTGPIRAATILAAHPAALVLCVESSSVTRVVTVLTREASGVPHGARTALSAADRPFAGICADDVAFVGGGSIRVAGQHYRAVRTTRTQVPCVRVPAEAVRLLGDAAGQAARGVPAEAVESLRGALDAGCPTGLRSAVRALVGLGSGSTPGGDDVLSGVLAALIATRRGVLAQQVAAAALPDLDSRTPLLSADLLRLAADGHVCLEAGWVLRAAAQFEPRRPASELELRRAITALLAIGHTSGADLATGMAMGLKVAPQPVPRRPRQSSQSSTGG